MRRIFDNYLMVDWSAANKTNSGSDSIWIGLLRRDVRLQLKFESFNPPTRQEAYAKIIELLESFEKRGDKTLIGFDFCLGYPSGTSEALGLKGKPQEAIYEFLNKEVIDKPQKDNNRFSVASMMNRRISNGPFPFWGCPAKDVLTTLQPKKTKEHDESTLSEYRLTEKIAKAASPVWKLYTPGSVGSQTIMGIPYVYKLRKHFKNSKLWPFEIGLDALNEEIFENTNIIITEIYPSMLKLKKDTSEVKDLFQVRTIAEYFANLDEERKLGTLFQTNQKLSDEDKEKITSEEGWILGF